MKWMRFRIRTTTAAEDIIISELSDLGLEGAQIEDHVPLTAAEKEQMFVDICPETQPDDGSAVLSFFVEENEDGTLKLEDRVTTPDEVKAGILAALDRLRTYSDIIGPGTVSVDETADVDWINNWKQYFHQFWIDDILAIPSWETPQIPADGRQPALDHTALHPADPPFSHAGHTAARCGNRKRDPWNSGADARRGACRGHGSRSVRPACRGG